MPNGVRGIADLVVRVSGDASGLASTIGAAEQALRGLNSSAGGNISGLVSLFAAGTETVAGLATRLTAIGRFVDAATIAIQAGSDVAEQVAESIGAGDEYRAAEAEAARLGGTLATLAANNLADVRERAASAAFALAGFAEETDAADQSASNFARDGLTRTRSIFEELRAVFTERLPARQLGLDEIATLLDRTEAQLANVRRLRDEALAALRAAGDSRGLAIADPNGAARQQEAALEFQQEILQQFQAIQSFGYRPIGTDTQDQDRFLAGLEQEIQLLERRAELVGTSAAASAAALARFEVERRASREGIGFAPEQERELEALLRRQEQARAALAAGDEARRRAELAERQDATAGNVIRSLQREVDAEVARREQLGLSAGAVARLASEERALSAIRASGREPTEAELEVIRYLGSEKEREVIATEQLNEANQRIVESAGALGRSLEGAFTGWIRGARTDWRDLVGQLLGDLAILNAQENFFRPLFGGAGSSSGGLVGDVLREGQNLLGSLFDGFRASGGPVSAGRAYLVGERGPELFIPAQNGAIAPNGALGGGVTVNTVIDARGASADAVAELRQMMAERDAALPGRVIEAVREARERGVA